MEKEPGCVRTGEMQNRLEEPTESDEALSTTKICKIFGFGVCAQKQNLQTKKVKQPICEACWICGTTFYILTPKRFMLFHVQLCTSIDVDVKNLPL